MAELERRGEKASLLAAFNDALNGPTYLKAPNSGSGDGFGTSVAMFGDTVIVGAAYEDGSGSGVNPASDDLLIAAGAAYVFVRSGGTWSHQAYLKASNTGDGDLFGYDVAGSGDTVVVGAPHAENASWAGAAYVFVRTDGVWSEQAILVPANAQAGDLFGNSVAISGNTVIVGAPREDGSGTGVNPLPNENATWAGAAYVFERSGSAWSQQAYLKASDTGGFERFGSSLAVSGDTIVVGVAPEWSDPPFNARDYSGAAYVFVRSAGTWSQQAHLLPSNPSLYDYFGISVAVSGDTVIVGASSEDGSGTGVGPASNDDATNAGAAYIFERSGETWSQQAYLKASNTGAGDIFGYSVAISGNTVVVGAVHEDGNGAGVNPASSENASSAGAAYVFERSGQTWSQRAYLKASNTGADDYFGYSVTISGSTVVVGAVLEDGNGTRVNPVANENALNAGAAYAFSVATAPKAPTPASQVDLNGDGNGDAFLYDPATGDWSRQLSQAGGGFAEESHGSWLPGWSVVPANLDGNVLTDFFLFNAATGAWSKMLNDGTTKNFTTQSSGFWWPGWQRFVLDLDGDNISDLFLYDSLTGQWFKCVSTPTGFTYAQGEWSPGWEITPITLNNDGLSDLFLIDRATGQWFWVLGQPGLAFLYPQTGTWLPSWQLSPGDFNGDALGDLLLHDPSSGQFYVAMNTGADFGYTGGYWSPDWTVGVADLDADGKDDLFLHNPDTGQWFEMISDGGGTFTTAGGQTWSLGWGLSRTDVDGDGRADMVLYDSTTGGWYQARNLVIGSFTYDSGAWSPGWTIVTRAPGR